MDFNPRREQLLDRRNVHGQRDVGRKRRGRFERDDVHLFSDGELIQLQHLHVVDHHDDHGLQLELILFFQLF